LAPAIVVSGAFISNHVGRRNAQPPGARPQPSDPGVSMVLPVFHLHPEFLRSTRSRGF